MLHQQAHDAAEAEIGGLGLVRCRHFGPRRLLANCAGLGDAEIMRESRRNNNLRFFALEGLQAGTTRMLISTAWGECVSSPTEIKSTPVSA